MTDGSSPVVPSSRVVTSPGNARVKELRKLHRRRGRDKAGLTLLEGPNLVAAARQAGVALVEVWATDGSGDVQCSDDVIAAISTTKTSQSPVGVMRIPEGASIRSADTLVLWDVTDDGNAGALIRTAAALSWDVAYTPGTADIWAPKVLRAGAGGHFATRLIPIASAADLSGLVPISAVARCGASPGAVPSGPYALLIGNEAHGLPRQVVAATTPVTIPTPGKMESLNAAVAGAILMWELRRPPSDAA